MSAKKNRRSTLKILRQKNEIQTTQKKIFWIKDKDKKKQNRVIRWCGTNIKPVSVVRGSLGKGSLLCS